MICSAPLAVQVLGAEAGEVAGDQIWKRWQLVVTSKYKHRYHSKMRREAQHAKLP
jgi:hypothetical protein